jgi:hypothetical protein
MDKGKLIQGKEFESALEIAEALALRVVGCIYSYADDHQNCSDKHGMVLTRILFQFLRGILFTEPREGQIQNMQKLGGKQGMIDVSRLGKIGTAAQLLTKIISTYSIIISKAMAIHDSNPSLAIKTVNLLTQVPHVPYIP